MQSFNEISIKLIESLENQDYDSLEVQLNNRERIIEEINRLSFDPVEFKFISDEFRILETENKLNKLFVENRQKLRAEIDKLNSSKRANNNYQRSYNSDSLFFNKKI